MRFLTFCVYTKFVCNVLFINHLSIMKKTITSRISGVSEIHRELNIPKFYLTNNKHLYVYPKMVKCIKNFCRGSIK